MASTSPNPFRRTLLLMAIGLTAASGNAAPLVLSQSPPTSVK